MIPVREKGGAPISGKLIGYTLRGAPEKPEKRARI